MLWMIATILLALWSLGLISGAELGLWVHWFFALALVAAALAWANAARTGRH